MISAVSMTDLDEVVKLEEACFPDAWSRASWERELTAQDRDVLGWRATKVVAVATFQTVGEVADLHKIAVSEHYRRCGVAAALLAEGLALVTRRGARRVLLEVAADNSAAIGLYTRLGFVEISRRAGYYPKSIDAIIMECQTL